MNQIQYGAKGSDVKRLQEILNNSGYGLDVDGEFGAKTQAAVRDYQSKNKLAVDGIVGTNTWNSLLGSSTKTEKSTKNNTPKKDKSALAGVSDKTAKNLAKYEKGYTPSDAVNKAQAYLSEVMKDKPGPFQSTYEDQLNDIYNKIMNREAFEYDLNGDMLYQQMKDQYQVMGKLAMQDTMGQAAALTGGYGNTYAQNVGQQVYNEHLRNLNDNIPELYQLALQKYNDEGSQMMQQYEMTGDMYNDEYAKYMDEYNQWLGERDFANSQYNSERDFDYSDYANMLNYWQGQANAENQDYWTQQDYDFQQAQFKYQQMQDQIANALKRSAGSNGGGGNGGSEPIKTANTNKAIEKILNFITGVTTSSVFPGGSNAIGSETESVVFNYLQNAIDAGEITEDQAADIMDKYFK